MPCVTVSHKFRLSCKNVIDVNIGDPFYVNTVNIDVTVSRALLADGS